MNIIHNKEESHFEYMENGETAYLKYSIYKRKNLALVHTKVPESMKGKGVASALAEFAFSYAKKNNKMVMVYCPFVSSYLKKHTELREQLNPEFHRTSTIKDR